MVKQNCDCVKVVNYDLAHTFESVVCCFFKSTLSCLIYEHNYIKVQMDPGHGT